MHAEDAGPRVDSDGFRVVVEGDDRLICLHDFDQVIDFDHLIRPVVVEPAQPQMLDWDRLLTQPETSSGHLVLRSATADDDLNASRCEPGRGLYHPLDRWAVGCSVIE